MLCSRRHVWLWTLIFTIICFILTGCQAIEVDELSRQVDDLSDGECVASVEFVSFGEGDSDHLYAHFLLKKAGASSGFEGEFLFSRSGDDAWKINREFAQSVIRRAEEAIGCQQSESRAKATN